jgi:hypothetical protein
MSRRFRVDPPKIDVNHHDQALNNALVMPLTRKSAIGILPLAFIRRAFSGHLAAALGADSEERKRRPGHPVRVENRIVCPDVTLEVLNFMSQNLLRPYATRARAT